MKISVLNIHSIAQEGGYFTPIYTSQDITPTHFTSISEWRVITDYIEMERYSFISPPISSWSHHLKIGKGVGLWCISSLCIINTLYIFVIASVMMMKHRGDESKTVEVV